MSDASRERLSALMDGELGTAEATIVLDEILRDASMRRTWERYHLVRDTLHADLAPTVHGDLAELVRSRIEGEPGLYRFELFRRDSLRPLAGLALAASVAVVAVLGVRGYMQRTDPAAGMVAQSQVPAERPQVATQAAAERFDPRLSAYLVNHSGHAGVNVHGVLPYARLVAQDGAR
jgi:sigma-E factor negative regulatory protein RseA